MIKYKKEEKKELTESDKLNMITIMEKTNNISLLSEAIEKGIIDNDLVKKNISDIFFSTDKLDFLYYYYDNFKEDIENITYSNVKLNHLNTAIFLKNNNMELRNNFDSKYRLIKKIVDENVDLTFLDLYTGYLNNKQDNDKEMSYQFYKLPVIVVKKEKIITILEKNKEYKILEEIFRNNLPNILSRPLYITNPNYGRYKSRSINEINRNKEHDKNLSKRCNDLMITLLEKYNYDIIAMDKDIVKNMINMLKSTEEIFKNNYVNKIPYLKAFFKSKDEKGNNVLFNFIHQININIYDNSIKKYDVENIVQNLIKFIITDNNIHNELFDNKNIKGATAIDKILESNQIIKNAFQVILVQNEKKTLLELNNNNSNAVLKKL